MAKGRKSQIIIEEVSTEREIAEMQLERLKHIAKDRLLTFEEVKIYDLLTKNLLLAKGEATSVVGTSRRVDDSAIDTQDLLQIAETIKPLDISKALNIVEDSDGSGESSQN